MSITANRASTLASDRLATRLFVGAFILAGVVAPFSLAVALPGYVYFVGPPLDFDAPRNGEVVAHIDVLGKVPPDIARIRLTEVATGATVWDVTPTTARSECWNLTLKAGSNPASFAAGHQQFTASVPQDPSILADAWNALSVRGVGQQGARRTRPLHALSSRRFRGTHPSPAAFQIRFSSTPFVPSPADFRSP